MRALIVLIALCGCTSGGAPRPPALPSSAASDEERALGREIHEHLGTAFGFYGERGLNAYLGRVGRRVATASTRRDLEFGFRVIDDAGVNAFAVPGGFVYVTRGLLAHLGSEAELAAVLAHEIAHIDRRHALSQRAFEAARSPAWSRADSLRFYERKRDNEREADVLATRALERLGYDPRALRSVLERLLLVEGALEAPGADVEQEAGWLESHPSTLARIARAAHALGPGPQRGQLGTAAHLEAIDGVTFGENPARGYMAGRSWVLPSLRLAFAVPAGWTHHESSRGLYARSADGRGLILLLRVPIRPDDSARERAERRSVAGRAADWFSLELESEYAGCALVIELGSEALWMIAAAPAAQAPELAQLPARFSVPDPRLGGRRAQRLSVTRAPAGATLDRLAAGGPVSARELGVLNALDQGRAIGSERWIKLVREPR